MKLLALAFLLFGTPLDQPIDFSPSSGGTFRVEDDWSENGKHLFASLTIKCKPPQKAFVITIPGIHYHWETCSRERVGALLHLDTTVWTQEEWEGAGKVPTWYVPQ